MKKLFFTIFLFLFYQTGLSYAKPVIADLSLREIKIDSGFTGEDILFFGARNDTGDIVVVVRGPEKSYIVRKKERVAGIWANKGQILFNNFYGYYAIAASRPLDEIRNDSLLKSMEIGVDNIDQNSENEEYNEFKQALINYKEKSNLFLKDVSDVSFIDETLFRTIIHFPDNIPRGTYLAEVYLFNDGELSGFQVTPLIVSKKGFDAIVYDFAHNYPAIYGITAIIIALLAGWVAGHIFRKI